MIIKYSRMDVILDRVEQLEVDVDAKSESEAIEILLNEIRDGMIERKIDHEIIAHEVREYYNGELYKIHYGFKVVE